MQQQQQQQQLQQQQQQQQQETTYERPRSMPQPQPQHPSYNFHQQNQNLDECSNNLNYAANNDSSSAAHNKYMRIIQRSRINQQQQQQQYQQNVYQQQRDFLQQLNWLEQHGNAAANNNSTTNIGANTGDLMYHNYNIQQGNKVGPKPNWRFRNLNEEFNPATNQQNIRHTAPTLQRYQNTLRFQQQQQQQQQQPHQTLHHFPNPAQRQLPVITQSQIQARHQQAFLLRQSQNIDIGVDEGVENYNFLNTQQGQQMPLDFSNPQQQDNNDNMLLDGNENNEDEEEEEEEDDTTSEEIKRNLLVNALKNDKFTTKFYESIKEDVFRRLESMLLDKDNINNETAGQQNQLFNNISNISLRKLNLNEQRDLILQQQQHQQQQQLHSHLDLAAAQNLNEEPRMTMTTATMNNETELPLSSSNNDNDNDNENEKPEEDTNWRQNVINNCNDIINHSPHSNNSNTSVNKKRKNLRKHSLSQSNTSISNTNETNDEDGNENLRGACSLAAQQHQKLQQETKDKNENKADTNISPSTNSPKSAESVSVAVPKQYKTTICDLIQYIINRIRNQTHTNTLINDALLVDVAKLTATVAQNAQPLSDNINIGNNASNISPKKIYAKIKKLPLPKERDEFLRWYQTYLENNVFGNNQQQQQQQQQQRQQQSSDKGKSTTKPTNNQQQQQQREQQNDLQPPTTDDGDLAEADQNCSLNNSTGGGCALMSNGVSPTYHQTFADNNTQSSAQNQIKSEPTNNGIEYENNENPDEAHTQNNENNKDNSNSKNCSEPANDILNTEAPLQTVIALKGLEPAVANTAEKSDLKCEKPEFTDKE